MLRMSTIYGTQRRNVLPIPIPVLQSCALLGLDLATCSKSIGIGTVPHRARNPGKQLNKKSTIRTFSNRQKIQRQFYRAHACFVKYFLMTKKWQQIKKLAYMYV